MPHYDAFDDGDSESWDESEDDFGDDQDAEIVPCPYCGKPVYEEAQRCPACENYLSREDAPLRYSRWFAAAVFVCLVIVVGWIIGC
jgi:hypothetical protein